MNVIVGSTGLPTYGLVGYLKNSIFVGREPCAPGVVYFNTTIFFVSL